MDTRLDQNQTKFGVFVLTITFEMLPDGNSFFDQSVQIFRNFRGHSYIWNPRIPTSNGSSSERQVIPSVMGQARDTSEFWYHNMYKEENAPFFFRMRRIFAPVTLRTWAIPCESRRITPISDGVNPFFANLQICSSTSSGVTFNHEGGVRLNGSADLEIPLPRLCMRPILLEFFTFQWMYSDKSCRPVNPDG